MFSEVKKSALLNTVREAAFPRASKLVPFLVKGVIQKLDIRSQECKKKKTGLSLKRNSTHLHRCSPFPPSEQIFID